MHLCRTCKGAGRRARYDATRGLWWKTCSKCMGTGTKPPMTGRVADERAKAYPNYGEK